MRRLALPSSTLAALVLISAASASCSLILGDYEVKGSTAGTGGSSTTTSTGTTTTSTAVGPLMVTPASAKIAILRSTSFTAASPVSWSVQEGASGGQIDATGKYISPDTPGIYHVIATSKTDATVTSTVAVTVVPLGLTVAGGIPGGSGNVDGPAAYAHFNQPAGVGYLGNGGSIVVVADTGNNTIRLFDASKGKTTTVAGTPGVTGTKDGTGPAAQFKAPTLIATNDNGQKVWVVDSGNDCIRNVDITSGAVTTLAGSCGTAGYMEGTGTAALFDNITGLALSTTGDALYTCEVGNTFRGIRRIALATGVTTLILGGLNDCKLAVSDYWSLIYYSDGGNPSAVYSIPDKAGGPGANPVATTVATPMPEEFTAGMAAATGYGNEDDLYTLSSTKPDIYHYRIGSSAFDTMPFSGDPTTQGDVDGPVTMAEYYTPAALTAYPPGGALYLTDTHLNVVRKIDINPTPAIVSTVLGVPANLNPVDGPTGKGRFVNPAFVAPDAAGNVYVGDEYLVRKIDSAGTLSLVAGQTMTSYPPPPSTDGTGANASLGEPFDGVVVNGVLYVVDVYGQAIRAVDVTTGKVTTLAGQLNVAGNADGLGVAASFTFVNTSIPIIGGALTTDGTNLYVADTGNYAIRQIVIATGEVSTLAGGTKGTMNGTGKAAQFLYPAGITYAGGTLYVADEVDSTIRAVDVKSGAVTTFFGLSGQYGDMDGNAATATLNHPFRLVADGIGNLFVAEYTFFGMTNQNSPNILRRIDLASQTISTFAGAQGQVGFVPGPLPATFNCPFGLGLTPTGDLLVTDPCDGVVGLISAL
jgi:hypothetical protein